MSYASSRTPTVTANSRKCQICNETPAQVLQTMALDDAGFSDPRFADVTLVATASLRVGSGTRTLLHSLLRMA
jgi:hypothetical protein